MKYCALAAALFLIFAGLSFGADIDGKWTGSIAGPDGGQGFPVSYTFKADGNTLTGTSLGPDNGQIPIKNGKIDGNNISFSISFDMGGQEMKMDFKGVLSGDQIKMSFDMMGTPSEFVVKRAK
ncbi:MAG: hypothetical protein ABSC60_04370 [Acidobacteriota bacterium]